MVRFPTARLPRIRGLSEAAGTGDVEASRAVPEVSEDPFHAQEETQDHDPVDASLADRDHAASSLFARVPPAMRAESGVGSDAGGAYERENNSLFLVSGLTTPDSYNRRHSAAVRAHTDPFEPHTPLSVRGSRAPSDASLVQALLALSASNTNNRNTNASSQRLPSFAFSQQSVRLDEEFSEAGEARRVSTTGGEFCVGGHHRRGILEFGEMMFDEVQQEPPFHSPFRQSPPPQPPAQSAPSAVHRLVAPFGFRHREPAHHSDTPPRQHSGENGNSSLPPLGSLDQNMNGGSAGGSSSMLLSPFGLGRANSGSKDGENMSARDSGRMNVSSSLPPPPPPKQSASSRFVSTFSFRPSASAREHNVGVNESAGASANQTEHGSDACGDDGMVTDQQPPARSSSSRGIKPSLFSSSLTFMLPSKSNDAAQEHSGPSPQAGLDGGAGGVPMDFETKLEAHEVLNSSNGVASVAANSATNTSEGKTSRALISAMFSKRDKDRDREKEPVDGHQTTVVDGGVTGSGGNEGMSLVGSLNSASVGGVSSSAAGSGGAGSSGGKRGAGGPRVPLFSGKTTLDLVLQHWVVGDASRGLSKPLMEFSEEERQAEKRLFNQRKVLALVYFFYVEHFDLAKYESDVGKVTDPIRRLLPASRKAYETLHLDKIYRTGGWQDMCARHYVPSQHDRAIAAQYHRAAAAVAVGTSKAHHVSQSLATSTVAFQHAAVNQPATNVGPSAGVHAMVE